MLDMATIEARCIPIPWSGCLVWLGATAGGYAIITRGPRGSSVPIYVHRIVYELVNGPIPEGREVCHTCDVRPCLEPRHLVAETHGWNIRDAAAKGRLGPISPERGEDRYNAKLTDDIVRYIRGSLETTVALGARFGVDHTLVSQVRRGKIWRHVS